MSVHGKTRGLMSGKTPKQVIELYNRLNKCTCGGIPIVVEGEGMGDFSLTIKCKKCNRTVVKSMYAGRKPDEYEEMCIDEWNKGLFYDEAMMGLKQAIEIEKGTIEMEEVPNMPKKTLRSKE